VSRDHNALAAQAAIDSAAIMFSSVTTASIIVGVTSVSLGRASRSDRVTI
jgi:hypothetical protein